MGSYDEDTSWDGGQGARGSWKSRAMLAMGTGGVLGPGIPVHSCLGPRMSAAALRRGEPGFRAGGEETGKSKESKIAEGSKLQEKREPEEGQSDSGHAW